VQLSEATSSANLASLALLANAPLPQAAPSDGGLFAEIFAALSKDIAGQTAAQPNTPIITNTLDTEPSWGTALHTPVARKPEALAPPNFQTPENPSWAQPALTDLSNQIALPSCGAASQAAASRLVSTLGLTPVPQTLPSNPVAPQPAGVSQPTTPSPTPDPVVQRPQAEPQTPLATISAAQPTPSTKPSAPPAKPWKKEPAPVQHAQNSQLPQIPLIVPAPQTPEPAPTQTTTNSSSPVKSTDQSTAPAPPPSNNSAVSLANPGNLSFAMRIVVDSAQPAPDPKSQSAPQQQTSTPTAAVPQSQPSDLITPAAAVSNHPEQQDQKPAPEQHTTNPTESLIAAPTESTPAPASETHPAHTAQPATPAPAPEIEPKPAAPTTEPLRNMHIQLTGDNNQRVNVHLMDRGGELRLSVKSADPALAQTMQEHMPELTSRLDQQRYRTEVWMPKETASSTSSNSNSTSSGFSNPGDGNPGGRQNGQQQQQNRPEWLEELEDNPRRPQTTRRN